MYVDIKDGVCRTCEGQLEIIDVDDVSMTVQCMGECGDCYDVETDAFGDGCLKYYVPLMANRLFGEVRDGSNRDPA